MPAAAPIPVVCAVIERAGLVLLAQRPVRLVVLVVFRPERLRVLAVVREIREELGCTVRLTRLLPPLLHDYHTVVIEMIPFVCVLAEGSPAPHPHEHLALAWVRPEALRSYDLAAADLPVITSYLGR